MAEAVEPAPFDDARHPGFPVEIFVEQDKIDDFICAICTEVCRDAVETSCTHIFCEGCLQQALEQKRECPLDHTPLKLEAVRVAGFVRRKVLNMRVKCPNFVSGCPAILVVSELSAHLRTCPHALIVCSRCRERVQARQLEGHRETECACREVRCEHCFSMVSFDDLKTHYSVHCPDMPVSCPNQCGDGPFPRKLIARHCDDVCPLQELRCRYAPHGCTKRVTRREMEAHLNDAKAHLDLVERHYASELEAIRRETTEMVRFCMQVGSQEAFMKLLAAVSAKSPVEEVELIVRGMRMYESEPTVQERGCFALITLCEAGNKMADANIAAVVSHRGIDVIVNAMRLHPQAVKVQEYALHVLRKMATNMDVKTFVQKGSIDCIGQILRTMQFHSSVIGIQRDAIGVLLNMAVNDSIESRIGHLGGIEQIIAAMDAFPGSTSLMQLACHALFHLTFDDHNKERLVSANALPRLMEALTRHSQHTNTVYYALRAMAQLAKIDRYRDKMRRLGLIDLARQALATHPGHKDLQKKVKMLLGRLLPSAGGPSPTTVQGDSGPSSPKS